MDRVRLGDFDVEVVLKDDQRVGSHKSVLSKHSLYFKNVLEKTEGKATLNLLSLTLDVFRKINEFLYNGYLGLDTTVDDCLNLIDPANTFKMEMLRRELIAKIKTKMEDGDVLKVLKAVAVHENLKELYDLAVEVIIQRPRDFLERDEFSQLGMYEVLAILDNERLKVTSEMEVLTPAFTWADYQAEQSIKRKRNNETRSYFFEMVLHCVRWPLLNPKTQIQRLLTIAKFHPKIEFTLRKIICGMEVRTGLQEVLELYGVKWWPRGQPRGDVYENMSVSDEEMNTQPSDANDVASGMVEEDEKKDAVSPAVPEDMEVDIPEIIAAGKDGAPGIHTNVIPPVDSLPNFQDAENIIHWPATPETMAMISSQLLELQTYFTNIIQPSENAVDPDENENIENMETTNCVPPQNTAPLINEPCQLKSTSFNTTKPSQVDTEQSDKSPIRSSKSNPGGMNEDDDNYESDFDPITRIVRISQKNRTFSSYRKLLKRAMGVYNGPEQIGTVELKNFQLQHRPNVVQVAERARIIVDGVNELIKGADVDHADRVKSLVDFIRQFDVLDYLVFRPSSLAQSTKPVKVDDIWETNQNILLRFNGINFLKIDHQKKEVVANYLKDSVQILSGCTKVKSMGVSNCQFALDKADPYNRQLEKLNLYRTWGTFSLQKIFTSFPNLVELRAWKFMPDDFERKAFPLEYSQRLVLSFSIGFPYSTLRVLVLRGAIIRLRNSFKLEDATPTNVEELKLEQCKFIPGNSGISFCDMLPKLFPKLNTLFLKKNLARKRDDEYNITSVHAVIGALQIPTLLKIRVVGLDWEYDPLSCLCNVQLTELFEKAEEEEAEDFVIERKNVWNGVSWKDEWILRCDRDNMSTLDDSDQEEMDWHELTLFYENREAFQLYMIQNEDKVLPKIQYF